MVEEKYTWYTLQEGVPEEETEVRIYAKTPSGNDKKYYNAKYVKNNNKSYFLTSFVLMKIYPKDIIAWCYLPKYKEGNYETNQ